MARVAPSIFATAAHESRSQRYTYIPTVDILNGLTKAGFEVFEVSQSRTRDLSRRECTKHMVRMRQGNLGEVGSEVPEVVLINSHDGTSAYHMMAGMFRLVCSNGLVVPAGLVNEVRVPHTGDVIGRVIEGAFSVVEDFDKVRDNAGRMKGITLAPREQEAFARSAIVAKFGELEPDHPTRAGRAAYPITTDQTLRARRHDDTGADLWSTFNRVQENLVRGGLPSRSANGRRLRTREVTGISQNVALNRALWTLADEMARLKAA
jgi:hypothetical protein